ncbi:MAG TPA: TetR/AcrR family transcriptional regulator [Myxococcales bacterium]|nr:TetR/AcrR family transcriptional regulator [Myxococcales bacterium]
MAQKVNPDSSSERRLKPLRERHRAETLAAIAGAAEEVFARKGLLQARVDEIAARAGVSVGTVYNHFRDRRALLSGLVERRRKELARKLDDDLARSEAEPFDAQLRSFTRTVFEHFESHREFLAILLEADSASLARPSEASMELRKRVDALAERGMRLGALRRDHAALWGTLLFGAVRALLLHELRNPGQIPLAERADIAAGFFLRGAGGA